MKEVSCRGVGLFLDAALERGIQLEDLVQGLPVNLGFLQDPRNRIDWDVCVELARRAERLFGGPEELRMLGHRHLSTESFGFMRRIAGLFTRPRDLYWMGVRWFGPSLLSNLIASYEDLRNGGIRETLEIPPRYRDCPALFHVIRGFMEVTPRMIGLPEARVDMHLSPRRAIYTITPPPSFSLRRRLRHAFGLVFNARAAIEELSAQQQELSASHAELNAAHEALRLNESKYRTLLEQASDGIFLENADGALEWVNQKGCEMLGYRREELLEKQTQNPGGSMLEIRARQLLESAPDGKTLVRETWLRRRDGTRMLVEASVKKLEEGRYQSILRDISERRRLEEQVRHSQKMEAVGELAGGIAHDFNNIMTAVLGCSTLILDELGPDHPVRPDVEEIHRSGERAASLTRHLLAFSRRQVLQPRLLDLNAVVRDLGAMLRRLIGKNITLTIRTAGDIGRVKADPGQIEQVLVNLAINARDAMRPGGTLTLETENFTVDRSSAGQRTDPEPGDYIMVSVRDEGCGMDTETLSRIFEPFFTTKEGQGTGLGLAVVYGIVKQSGGTIMVSSDPGKGTCFQILLPRTQGTPEVLESRARAPHVRGGSETLLLVEDEATVRRLSRRALEALGYRVLEASDGVEALRITDEHPEPIALAITDLVMPKMDGVALAARLVRQQPDLRVLYTSGYARSGLEADAEFLPKPFTPDVLGRRVREMLDGPGER